MNRGPRTTIASIVFCLGLTACHHTILHDLSEPEANDLVTELAQAGVRGTKAPSRGGRFEVRVPTREADLAWRVARAAGFPRHSELVAPRRLILAPAEAQDLDRRRRASRLARLIRSRAPVMDAHVVLDGRGAAVQLRVRPAARIDAEAIAALVRVGAGLSSDAPVHIESAPVTYAAVESLVAPPTHWPIRLAASAALCLAAMCAFLVFRLRRTRRKRG
jgi:predicted Rdx family selenoprotein